MELLFIDAASIRERNRWIGTAPDGVNALIDSVQNGEGTIGKFIKDPSLFNNVNQVTSELEKLMYDFRQNPKKFLTVNFRLF
jgi:phospholipid/cholesterol/gamma-HCH transport system substrate-binding protein